MRSTNATFHRLLALSVGVFSLVTLASATESGASVCPAGAESVAMATAVPRPGQSRVYEYTCQQMHLPSGKFTNNALRRVATPCGSGSALPSATCITLLSRRDNQIAGLARKIYA